MVSMGGLADELIVSLDGGLKVSSGPPYGWMWIPGQLPSSTQVNDFQ